MIITKRYKQHMKNTLIRSDPTPPPELARTLDTNPLNLKYLVIVDFEATCEEQNPADYVHEVIEFPALLFNMQELRIVSYNFQWLIVKVYMHIIFVIMHTAVNC